MGEILTFLFALFFKLDFTTTTVGFYISMLPYFSKILFSCTLLPT